MTSARNPIALLLLPALLLTLAGCDRPPVTADPLAETGDWTFINYWANWCKPCIKEIPELNALHAMSGYRVLGVNYDGASGEALQGQLDALGVGFPTLAADPAPRFALERPQVLPTTLVLDPTGKLRHVLVGPQTEESLIALTKAPQGASSGN